jgi:hypothetical protein
MKITDYTDLERLIFPRQKTLVNNSAGTRNRDEDIITIDSQVDLRLHRDLPESKILNAATEFAEQKMTSFLEYEFSEFSLPKHNTAEDFSQPGDNRQPAFDELKKLHIKKFTEAAAARAKSHRQNKFLFSIEPGFEIIVPPYDVEGSNSFISFSGANKASSGFKSFPIGNGYGASGLGVFLSPTADVAVTYSAHCPISYSWSNYINEGGGYAASRGGMGITIYNASRQILVEDEHEVLWSQSKRPSRLEISGGNEDLLLQNTALANTHFKMKANEIYLVWLWCWAFADASHNAAAFANIDCKVPFMIVDSSTD